MNVPAAERTFTKERFSIIVRKVIVTVIVGILAYVLTENMLDDDGPWAIMASVFLGGVAFVTQFLVDVERRMERLERTQADHRRALDRRVDVRFRQVGEATKLHDMVFESKIPTSEVGELIRSAVKVDLQTPDLAAKLAGSERNRMMDFLRQLHRNGEAFYEGEDRDWLLGLTRHVSASMKATSLTTVDSSDTGAPDNGLWQTDLGMRYLEFQKDAIQRGVRIQRIFVLDMPTDPIGPFIEIMQQHRDRGVDVRVINPMDVQGDGVSPNAHYDFILFDDSLSYETTPAARPDLKTAPYILHTRIRIQPETVKERIRRFDMLWRIAQDLDMVIAGQVQRGHATGSSASEMPGST